MPLRPPPHFAGLALLVAVPHLYAQTPTAGVWQAAYDGDIAAVRAMLDKAPDLVDAPDPQAGTTPLHWAAFGGRMAVVSLLLERGARVDPRNVGGGTPLQAAAAVGADAVVALLLEKGADVAARDAEGKSARDWAVGKGHMACAAALADAESALLKQLAAEEAPEGAVWMNTFAYEVTPARGSVGRLSERSPMAFLGTRWPDQRLRERRRTSDDSSSGRDSGLLSAGRVAQ